MPSWHRQSDWWVVGVTFYKTESQYVGFQQRCLGSLSSGSFTLWFSSFLRLVYGSVSQAPGTWEIRSSLPQGALVCGQIGNGQAGCEVPQPRCEWRPLWEHSDWLGWGRLHRRGLVCTRSSRLCRTVRYPCFWRVVSFPWYFGRGGYKLFMGYSDAMWAHITENIKIWVQQESDRGREHWQQLLRSLAWPEYPTSA